MAHVSHDGGAVAAVQGVPHGSKVMPLTIRQMVVQQVQLESIRRREAVCTVASTQFSLPSMPRGGFLPQHISSIGMMQGSRLH